MCVCVCVCVTDNFLFHSSPTSYCISYLYSLTFCVPKEIVGGQ